MNREAIVIGPDNTPILDMDPIDLENSGDIVSAWDQDLKLVLDSIEDYRDETDIDGLRLVWSDTMSFVMVECPSCGGVKRATSFAVDDVDSEYVTCIDCLND
jgi:hypothetical protein